MERNALIVRVSPLLVVGHAHYREGGTWLTAVESLRKHNARVCVYDEGSEAARALVALGASPVRTPEDVLRVRAQQHGIGGLFGLTG